MSDLIIRDALIEAHYQYCNEHPDASFPTWSLRLMKYAPSVRPERKKGKWELSSIMHSMPPMYVYRCSECGRETFGMYDFCPNCGAEMTEERE